MEQMKQRRVFNDLTFPASFITLKYNLPPHNFQITMEKNPVTGMVDAVVEGEDIDAAINELYKNPSVPLFTFIKELKSLRSMAFSLKGGKNAA